MVSQYGYGGKRSQERGEEMNSPYRIPSLLVLMIFLINMKITMYFMELLPISWKGNSILAIIDTYTHLVKVPKIRYTSLSPIWCRILPCGHEHLLS